MPVRRERGVYRVRVCLDQPYRAASRAGRGIKGSCWVEAFNKHTS